jgi:hypothetical protein
MKDLFSKKNLQVFGIALVAGMAALAIHQKWVAPRISKKS